MSKHNRNNEDGGKGCKVCRRIQRIEKGINPYFVAELETGYLVLEDYQRWVGYVIFLCKLCVPELHLLEKNFLSKFLEEMSQVAEAVFRSRKPKKLNLEILGNKWPHLHVHVIPRYEHEGGELLKNPIWSIREDHRHQEAWWLFDEEIGSTEELKQEILSSLRSVGAVILSDYHG